MCIQNRLFSLIFKLVILAFSALATLTALFMVAGGYSSVHFLYYTTLSALLAFVYYFVAAITVGVDMKKKGLAGAKTAGPHVRGGITMALLLGMLVFPYVIPDTPFARGALLPVVLVHFVLPVLVLLDWALFDLKGRYRFVDPLWWLVFPYGYYLFAIDRILGYIARKRAEKAALDTAGAMDTPPADEAESQAYHAGQLNSAPQPPNPTAGSLPPNDIQ